MSVGERIADLRKEQNLSQGNLADALGISRQAVSKWENDQAYPDALKLIQLAEVLNTEVEYLATGRKPMYEEAPIVLNMVKKSGQGRGSGKNCGKACYKAHCSDSIS